MEGIRLESHWQYKESRETDEEESRREANEGERGNIQRGQIEEVEEMLPQQEWQLIVLRGQRNQSEEDRNESEIEGERRGNISNVGEANKIRGEVGGLEGEKGNEEE